MHGNPEELVEPVQVWQRLSSLQHGELLPEHEVPTRSRRLRKRRAKAPNQSKNTLNMIGVITERWRWGGRYVIHFKVGESFGEAQVVKLGLNVLVRRAHTGIQCGSFHLVSPYSGRFLQIIVIAARARIHPSPHSEFKKRVDSYQAAAV